MSDTTTLAGLTATQKILLVDAMSGGQPTCGCGEHGEADPAVSIWWRDIAFAPSDLDALVSFGLALRYSDGGGALTHKGLRIARLAKGEGQGS